MYIYLLSALIISLQKYIRSEHRDYNLSAYVNEARYLLSNINNAKDLNLAEKVENVLRFVIMQIFSFCTDSF